MSWRLVPIVALPLLFVVWRTGAVIVAACWLAGELAGLVIWWRGRHARREARRVWREFTERQRDRPSALAVRSYYCDCNDCRRNGTAERLEREHPVQGRES